MSGKPASAKSVRSYLVRAFINRQTEARAAREGGVASHPPEELNRVGFRLYERVPAGCAEGGAGVGAKGELRVGRNVRPAA